MDIEQALNDLGKCIGIGSEIYLWRIHNRVSPEELARKSGVDVGHILQFEEGGSRVLSPDQMSRICSVIDLTFEELCNQATTRLGEWD